MVFAEIQDGLALKGFASKVTVPNYRVFGIRVEMSNKNSGRCYDKRNQDVLSAPYEIRD